MRSYADHGITTLDIGVTKLTDAVWYEDTDTYNICTYILLNFTTGSVQITALRLSILRYCYLHLGTLSSFRYLGIISKLSIDTGWIQFQTRFILSRLFNRFSRCSAITELFIVL